VSLSGVSRGGSPYKIEGFAGLFEHWISVFPCLKFIAAGTRIKANERDQTPTAAKSLY